jgi:hypothetical protein
MTQLSVLGLRLMLRQPDTLSLPEVATTPEGLWRSVKGYAGYIAVRMRLLGMRLLRMRLLGMQLLVIGESLLERGKEIQDSGGGYDLYTAVPHIQLVSPIPSVYSCD